jgi:hypothetical protein
LFLGDLAADILQAQALLRRHVIEICFETLEAAGVAEHPAGKARDATASNGKLSQYHIGLSILASDQCESERNDEQLDDPGPEGPACKSQRVQLIRGWERIDVVEVHVRNREAAWYETAQTATQIASMQSWVTTRTYQAAKVLHSEASRTSGIAEKGGQFVYISQRAASCRFATRLYISRNTKPETKQ